MKPSTESLARSAARRPWRTVAVWVVLLITAGALASQLLGDSLTTDTDFTNEPEAKTATLLLQEKLRGADRDIEFVVVTAETEATEADYQAYVGELQGAIAGLGPDVVEHVGSYLTEDGPVSESGTTTLLPVTLADGGTTEGDAAELVSEAVAEVSAPAGFRALVAGPATLENEFIELAEEGLKKGEGIGILVALVVLILVFGAVVAGLIPIILGIASIMIALGAAALFGQVFELPFFISNIITMIGLAVGIDYSLFIVSRFREERADGHEISEAIGRAGATAGKAVAFSGLTVVIALSGMFLLPNTIYRSMGLGAILVVMIAVAASMTLLPAVLSLMGDKVNALKIRGRRNAGATNGRFWERIAGVVMRRPVTSLLAAGGLLVIAALPFFSMHEGFSGVSTLPDGADSKEAFLILEDEFSGGLGSPVEIVVDGTIDGNALAAIDDLRASLDGDRSFGTSTLEVNDAGDLGLVSVPLNGDIAGDAAIEVVRDVRDVVVPAAFEGTGIDVYVGGDTAYNIDYLDQARTYTPIVFMFVLGLSFVLLTVAFRSLVIPVKAIAMNLLSVGAAYGMVTMFFQEGVGPGFVKDIASWLGFGQVEAIEAGMPLFMFSILFGLSMDYHVFLLSRIRERFDQTGDNAESVAHGLRTTGRLITGAAAIMVAVFAGFAAAPLVGLQQMGFGLAVAVALDATIVRSILVPATMKLLGDRNWYLPSWLQWLPQIHIEGTTTHDITLDDLEPELVPVG